MRRALLWLALLGFLMLAACGHGAAPPPAPEPDLFSDDPVAVLADVEKRLLESPHVEIAATIETHGVLETKLSGTLTIDRERATTIDVDGEISKSPIKGHWVSTAPVEDDQQDVQPGTWADSILYGVTRMGVFHNWAQVIGQRDPDIAHGDMASWVEIVDVDWKGEPSDRTLGFRILVAGEETGSALLTLDARGLPLRRVQTWYYREGDATERETYTSFVVK